ncbi:hypothetical protein L9F63_027326 [Diploptera punctata]|uniref:CHK kinase-like domain-containing protein n=1 Tax=Diploptera punctata TaxID=6984 RepID=A0AAD8EM39_DIPPU|nr:hypothetical protein L9F63_021837 [Diploptera punctata]KAJ9595288.1 hypothetical protein L9F63_027326 [Diploptera punctata]
MSTQVPEWLNTAFVEKLLKDNECNKKVSLISVDVKSAVPKGENYLGILRRVEVSYTNEDEKDLRKYTFITKSPPLCESTRKFMNNVKALQTETIVYKTILPAMYQLIDKKEGIFIKRLSPQHFESSLKDTLVLEDMTMKGYIMKDRLKLFDFDHAKAVVISLARFHGLSHAIYLRNPTLFYNVHENHFTDSPDRLNDEKEFSEHRINMLIKELGKCSKLPASYYIDKLLKVTDNIVDRVREVVKPIKDSISVLNHGDCWVNNILFHYNSVTENIDDVKLIDFQMCRFSSPVLDLHYFLYTSVRAEVLFGRKNDLLQEYYKEFSRILTAFNHEPKEYAFEQFEKEFYEKEYFGFFNSITKLYAVLAEPVYCSEEAKAWKNGKEKFAVNKCANNELLEDMFIRLFPYFEEKGFI